MFIVITYTPITKIQADLAIGLLSNIGFDAFEEQEQTLIASIPLVMFDKEEFAALQPIINTKYTLQEVEQINWNAAWESSYQPIFINEHVGIRAHFHTPLPVSTNIVITPQMSFGTGHHATTKMMMEYIYETNCTNKAVLDYGCGTGVLAIYAAIKGAQSNLAIDIDDWCVTNTLDNMALNNINNITAIQGDLDAALNQKFDIIFANINLYILLKNASTFYNLLNKGGSLFLSGILAADLPELRQKFISQGFVDKSTKQQLEWRALHICKI
jgi:ribosomal protein L11 methyltransferase